MLNVGAGAICFFLRAPTEPRFQKYIYFQPPFRRTRLQQHIQSSIMNDWPDRGNFRPDRYIGFLCDLKLGAPASNNDSSNDRRRCMQTFCQTCCQNDYGIVSHSSFKLHIMCILAYLCEPCVYRCVPSCVPLYLLCKPCVPCVPQNIKR